MVRGQLQLRHKRSDHVLALRRLGRTVGALPFVERSTATSTGLASPIEEIDSLLEQGRVEGDPDKRRAIYLELEQKLMEEALSAPLVDEFSVWATQANVDGLMFNGFTYPIITEVQMAQ